MSSFITRDQTYPRCPVTMGWTTEHIKTHTHFYCIYFNTVMLFVLCRCQLRNDRDLWTNYTGDYTN